MENGSPETVPEIVKLLLGMAGIAITALGAWLVALTPKFGTKKQNQIDQLQEDVKSLLERVNGLDATIDKQRQVVNKMFARDFAWQRRNWELEQQILEGKPAPFPALSSILTAIITIEE